MHILNGFYRPICSRGLTAVSANWHYDGPHRQAAGRQPALGDAIIFMGFALGENLESKNSATTLVKPRYNKKAEAIHKTAQRTFSQSLRALPLQNSSLSSAP